MRGRDWRSSSRLPTARRQPSTLPASKAQSDERDQAGSSLPLLSFGIAARRSTQLSAISRLIANSFCASST